jgi:hypothetical protein
MTAHHQRKKLLKISRRKFVAGFLFFKSFTYHVYLDFRSLQGFGGLEEVNYNSTLVLLLAERYAASTISITS